MKTVLMSTSAVALVATLVGVVSLGAAPIPAANSSPTKAANFELTDTNRVAHSLYYYNYAPAIVLMSQSDGSPLSRSAAAELARLQAAYKDKGVVFFMINSNLSDTREQAAAEAAAQKFQVPLLMDELQFVGEQLNVKREAEVFVIDPKANFKVAYRGPLDDRFNSAAVNLDAKARNAYAASAIDAVLAGQPVANARVDVKAGRLIAFPDRAKAADYSKISYSKTVAPIIEAKCVSCHQKGGIGPFEMNSYEVVKNFAPMMRETVVTRRMPPWFADPHIGHFANDFGLTADEKKTLVHWIDAGAPRGEGEDILKLKIAEAPEWPAELGKPDIVVSIPAYNVPASGIVDYQNIAVPSPFKSDVYLRAIAFKPGARSVVHHIVSSYSPDPALPAPKVQGGYMGAFVPGGGVQINPANVGTPVPAGGNLTFQMHYTTTGKAQTDVSQVAYYLAKTPPTQINRTANILGTNLHIPAGEANHLEVAYLEFPADAVVYTVHAHAHFRGVSAELDQMTPDGKITPIIALPRYDFNWQLQYDLAQPLTIKAGTKLIVREIYDNSIHNKANPDPKRNIDWGEQTMDEMTMFRVSFRWVDESVSHVRNDLQAKMMESRVIGALDANVNGKVEAGELRGVAAPLKPQFAKLDLNHDGGLDQVELTAAMKAINQYKKASATEAGNLN